MTKKKLVLMVTLTLSMMLTTCFWLVSVWAQGMTVGVQAGNTFEYSVQYATSNSELFGAENFTVTVLNVTGSTANYELVLYYPNGTTVNDTDYIDLSNGYSGSTSNGYNGQGSWVAVAANLNAGDVIYPGWSWTINDTVTMNGRQTNHLSANNAYLNNSGQNVFVAIDAYCDKITGAAVNISLNTTGVNTPGETVGFTYTLMDSNTVPEISPTAFAVTMIILAACAAVMVHRRKMIAPHLQHQLRRSP